jgi:hypothetical protein
MVIKPINAYQHIRVSYIMNIAGLLHVLATLVAILRVVHYNGYIKNVFGPMAKGKILSSKNLWFKTYIAILQIKYL